jgi:hypothetical protein
MRALFVGLREASLGFGDYLAVGGWRMVWLLAMGHALQYGMSRAEKKVLSLRGIAEFAARLRGRDCQPAW